MYNGILETVRKNTCLEGLINYTVWMIGASSCTLFFTRDVGMGSRLQLVEFDLLIRHLTSVIDFKWPEVFKRYMTMSFFKCTCRYACKIIATRHHFTNDFLDLIYKKVWKRSGSDSCVFPQSSLGSGNEDTGLNIFWNFWNISRVLQFSNCVWWYFLLATVNALL